MIGEVAHEAKILMFVRSLQLVQQAPHPLAFERLDDEVDRAVTDRVQGACSGRER